MKFRYIASIIVFSAIVIISGCSKKDDNQTNGYIEGYYTYLSSPIPGKLDTLSVYRGNKISLGEKLFQLDPNPQLAERNGAQASWSAATAKLRNLIDGQRDAVIKGILAQKAQAKAKLNLSEITLKRYNRLYKENVISKQTLDETYATYESDLQALNEINANLSEAKLGARKNLILAQEAEVKSAKSNLDKLNWELQQKTISAPVNGLVYNTFYEKGEYVLSDKPVVALLAPQNVKVIFFVNERKLSQIKLNKAIYFIADGGHRQKATIDYISPQAEYTPPIIYSQKSRGNLVYRIEASIPISKALQFHPGQPVSVFYG